MLFTCCLDSGGADTTFLSIINIIWNTSMVADMDTSRNRDEPLRLFFVGLKYRLCKQYFYVHVWCENVKRVRPPKSVAWFSFSLRCVFPQRRRLYISWSVRTRKRGTEVIIVILITYLWALRQHLYAYNCAGPSFNLNKHDRPELT